MKMGSEQLWFDLFQLDRDKYKGKIIEELTELSLAYQHYQDGKTTMEDVAEEIADVQIQLNKILHEIPNIQKEYHRQCDKKMLHLFGMLY